ncbi:hypothetical protein [Methylophaga sp.]|uniref:hypothetical protein n=1 Tax=Methylophaga sp. TaxID=2024840 RepID=UPI0025F346F8|nr:hypothetical protein [Methylophaga sp.]
MNKLIGLFALILSITLTGCGYDEFHGRFVGPEGNVSYEFNTDGTLEIHQGEDVTTAEYEYDSGEQLIKLKAEDDLPTDTLTVKDEDHLQIADMTLTRGVDYAMLADTTWIGHQGQYSFALRFTMTEKGMETVSELVTYHDDDMTYLSQTDDSITRLRGNMLLLDLTPYTVSEVTRDSFKITIGENSMILEKHPKDTDITIRDDYQPEGE